MQTAWSEFVEFITCNVCKARYLEPYLLLEHASVSATSQHLTRSNDENTVDQRRLIQRTPSHSSSSASGASPSHSQPHQPRPDLVLSFILQNAKEYFIDPAIDQRGYGLVV
jgi:hypothetical protein